MRIIITENQQNSLQLKLKKMVKDIGWEKTSIAVGGSENLVKLAFNNNPMNFLNMFNDLDVVQSKEKEYWTLFRYEIRGNIMLYDRKNEYVYINYDVIWSFLEYGFGFNYSEIQELTQEWLSETYNLRGVTTTDFPVISFGRLSETYNLRGVTTRFTHEDFVLPVE
jgi:hypothetical protein